MTDATSHIEQMQQRLETIAAREQLLIDALNDALVSADRKLLDDVRNVTTEHETRRTLILSELQTLAERIGAFPVTASPVEAIEHDAPEAAGEPGVEITTAAALPEPEAVAQGGDWRTAAKKITDELDFHLNGNRPRYSTN